MLMWQGVTVRCRYGDITMADGYRFFDLIVMEILIFLAVTTAATLERRQEDLRKDGGHPFDLMMTLHSDATHDGFP